MSVAKGPGWCEVPMWWGTGMPAGCCDEPAYGPTAKNDPLIRCGERLPRTWACPAHGGPPKCPETEILRDAAMGRAASTEGGHG